MANVKRVLVKIRRVGKGPYSGQFDCRRGDVVLLPRGEGERLMEDSPDEWKSMPPSAKVTIYAQHIKDPREGEVEMEVAELPQPETDEEDGGDEDKDEGDAKSTSKGRGK